MNMQRWKICLSSLIINGAPLITLNACTNNASIETHNVTLVKQGEGTIHTALIQNIKIGTKLSQIEDQILPIPEQGWDFSGYFIDGTYIDKETYEITSDVTITVCFVPNIPPTDTHNVTLKQEGQGSIGVTLIQNVPNGTRLSQIESWISPDPDDGWKFDGYYIEGVPIDTQYIIQADVEITVKFVEDIPPIGTHTVTLVKEGEGIIKTSTIKGVPDGTKLVEIENDIGPVPKEEWLFDGYYKNNETHEPIDKNNYEINDDLTIIVSFIPVIPIAKDFSTDSWYTVAYYANQGLDALCDAYDCEASDFVGQQRQIFLNNHWHTVMVVDTNKDFYKVGSDNKNAALTFEFQNVISKKTDGSALTINWEHNWQEKDNGSYWQSTLENALNSTEDNVDWFNDSDEHQSVYSMITAFDPQGLWTSLIKPVCRTVNEYDSSTWTPQEQTTKIFVPTLTSFFSANGLSDKSSSVNEQADIYISEGLSVINKQYAYYADINVIFNEPFIIGQQYEPLLRCDCSSDKVAYSFWFSSPCVTRTNSAWSISADKSIYNTYIVSANAVAPCFCL